MRALTMALALLLAPAAGHAQQLGERLPGQRSETGMPRGAAREPGMRPCPQYGPGFVRIEGSQTCVRLGGEVRFEYGFGGRRSGNATGARSGAMIELDARTETELGQVRAVVRGGGAIDSGLMQGRRW